MKVMTFGTFDIFHEGHKFFLNSAKKHGDFLITIIATDKNVLKLKGKKPLNNENFRKQKVKEAGISDIVEIGDENNPLKWIDFFEPEIIFLGYDQKGFSSLLTAYPHIKIIRGDSYFPEKFKSSILKKQIFKKRPTQSE